MTIIKLFNNKPVTTKVAKSFYFSTGRPTVQMSSCIFCKIISGEAPGEIYYQDDEILVFKDIKPASKFHFLAVPKEHIHNVNSLTKDHIPLIQRFISKSKEILSEKGGSVDDIRFGFHLPPFNSVSHLHLHVISPASEMSYLSRLIFKPNSWWFASEQQILEKLETGSKL